MFVMMMERKRENRAVENDVLILDSIYVYVCIVDLDIESR
jgi:hypothetical protein